ncbi:MAG: hypothetical protein U1E66_10915 [Rhodospirillales bacterium]
MSFGSAAAGLAGFPASVWTITDGWSEFGDNFAMNRPRLRGRREAGGMEKAMKNKLVRDVVTEFVVPLLLASLVIGLVAFWPFSL